MLVDFVSVPKDHDRLHAKTETCPGCKVYKANGCSGERVDMIVNKVLKNSGRISKTKTGSWKKSGWSWL
jgi:hypothetical protein